MSRIAAAKSLASFAWALVRYSAMVLRSTAAPTPEHIRAELRWLANVKTRYTAFCAARDEWRRQC